MTPIFPAQATLWEPSAVASGAEVKRHKGNFLRATSMRSATW